MALIFEVKNHIAYITINRPEVMNAMDPETYEELSQSWIEVRDNPEIWCAIVTGAGNKSFSAGGGFEENYSKGTGKMGIVANPKRTNTKPWARSMETCNRCC